MLARRRRARRVDRQRLLGRPADALRRARRPGDLRRRVRARTSAAPAAARPDPAGQRRRLPSIAAPFTAGPPGIRRRPAEDERPEVLGLSASTRRGAAPARLRRADRRASATRCAGCSRCSAPRTAPRRSRRRRAGPAAARSTRARTVRRGAAARRRADPAGPPAPAARRPRRLVLLLDVSGSMTPYADALLRFAHAAVRRRPTAHRGLHARHPADPDHPGAAPPRPGRRPAAASAAIPDWHGGTRLADALRGVPRPVGAARHRPRRGRGGLQRRLGARRPGRAGRADSTGCPGSRTGWSGSTRTAARTASRRWPAGWPPLCRTSTTSSPGTAGRPRGAGRACSRTRPIRPNLASRVRSGSWLRFGCEQRAHPSGPSKPGGLMTRISVNVDGVRLRRRRRTPHPARPSPARTPRQGRHRGRLRHQQLRRLHRPDVRRRRRAARRQELLGARRAGRRPRGHHDRGPGRPRRHAAPGAAGVPRAARAAVRLLHARHDHGRGRPAARRTPTRPTRRSAKGSRATSAAAPATRTSCARSATRPPRSASRRRPPSRRRRRRSPARPTRPTPACRASDVPDEAIPQPVP